MERQKEGVIFSKHRMTKRSHSLDQARTMFALTDGGTSRQADVAEQSAHTGACGLTSVCR